jgi:hypothetical protein
MSIYSDQLKAHLARYKREHLQIATDGLWRSKQRPYRHILPEALQHLNVLETIRDEFWAYHDSNRATLGLHTDFHHLNSSQAFAFNLFFPWVNTPSARQHLLAALGLGGEEIVCWYFEHMPDQAERTTVDLYFELASHRRVLIEVKLTEEHFGGIVPKVAHRTKLESTYRSRLAGKAKPESLQEDVFFLNYQLFRNLSHLDISKADRLILVLPRANDFTWQQAGAFLQHLESSAEAAVQVIAVEDLWVTLAAGAPDVSPLLSQHMHLLQAKYLLGSPRLTPVAGDEGLA